MRRNWVQQARSHQGCLRSGCREAKIAPRLGGKSPTILLDNADLDTAIPRR